MSLLENYLLTRKFPHAFNTDFSWSYVNASNYICIVSAEMERDQISVDVFSIVFYIWKLSNIGLAEIAMY